MAAGVNTGFSARRADAAVRRRSLRGIGSLIGVFLTLAIATASATATAQEEPFPLKPPDNTSPRDTLYNLIDDFVEAHLGSATKPSPNSSAMYWASFARCVSPIPRSTTTLYVFDS